MASADKTAPGEYNPEPSSEWMGGSRPGAKDQESALRSANTVETRAASAAAL